MTVEVDQLLHLQNILHVFASSTGSSLIPINIDHSKATTLADTVGCKVGSMPFTYSRLTLGNYKAFNPGVHANA